MKPSRFIHPVHARGVQGQKISAVLGPLTDKKIREYTLAGRYGDAAKTRASVQKKKKSLSTMKQALKLLGL